MGLFSRKTVRTKENNLNEKAGNGPAPWDTEETFRARVRMVDEQIEGRGIKDQRVIQALRELPRHLFVPGDETSLAYTDRPLPLGSGQTISQPYMVALMTEALALQGWEKVLEIGTGSGYQGAVLSMLSARVFSIERVGALAERARRTLEKLEIRNIEIIEANGSLGLPEEAPFDAIVVTAAAPSVPRPLLDQLADGGRLVLPVGDRYTQNLVRITKEAGNLHRESLGLCAFVPLIGSEGWDEGSG